MSAAFSVSLIWLLGMLAASAHLTDVGRRPIEWAQALLAFALSLAAAWLLLPQPNWVGVLVSLTAIWRLIAGPLRAGALLAGVCAGLVTALQLAGGLSFAIAVPLGLAGLAGAGLTVRPAPTGCSMSREIALIAAALVSPAVGLAADLAYGWQSATVLNRAAEAASAPGAPAWAIAILALALLAGALRGWWVKR